MNSILSSASLNVKSLIESYFSFFLYEYSFQLEAYFYQNKLFFDFNNSFIFFYNRYQKDLILRYRFNFFNII